MRENYSFGKEIEGRIFASHPWSVVLMTHISVITTACHMLSAHMGLCHDCMRVCGYLVTAELCVLLQLDLEC